MQESVTPGSAAEAMVDSRLNCLLSQDLETVSCQVRSNFKKYFPEPSSPNVCFPVPRCAPSPKVSSPVPRCAPQSRLPKGEEVPEEISSSASFFFFFPICSNEDKIFSTKGMESDGREQVSVMGNRLEMFPVCPDGAQG